MQVVKTDVAGPRVSLTLSEDFPARAIEFIPSTLLFVANGAGGIEMNSDEYKRQVEEPGGLTTLQEALTYAKKIYRTSTLSEA